MSTIKRIFIIGQPGAGKGLLAKTLADKLNWRFIDADLQLEYRAGKPLIDIMGESGVSHYQQNQYDILNMLQQQQHIVVATDAGIVGNQACREALASEFVVDLTVSTAVQVARQASSAKPLLSNDIEALLNRLHDDRDQLNADVAAYTLNSDDNNLDEHVQTIVELVSVNGDANLKKKQFSDSELTFYNHKTHRPVRISTRQAMCLQLLAKGLSDKQIADQLFISTRTVEDHIANTKHALGCRTAKELIALFLS